MLYKHWKKIALTLAAMFWTSCDDTSSSAEEVPQVSPSLYGIEMPCDTESCMVIPESSEANDEQSSSSEAIASSSSEIAKPESSSKIEESSSSEVAQSSSSLAELLSSSSIAQSSSSDIDESSSSFELPVPAYGGFPVYCYNDTAVSDSGKVFDIVVCDNGEKYLRFQSLYMDIPEKQKELPKGVNPVPPAPDSIYARNCTREPDICIDGFTIDDNGNEQPVGGCYPSIECPEKPQT